MRLHRMSAAAVIALTATAVAGTSAAHADPKPAPVAAKPATYRTYAAVGSDTIQDVWNALANGYAKHPATVPAVASWDAFPAGKIVTKAKGPAFARPAGSGAGVKALTASVKGTAYSGTKITGQVDFARSSSGPAAGSGLTYLPFARDAVSVAVKTTASGTISLTTNDLIAIYTCKKTSVTTSTKQVVKVSPKLPQAGSGTLKFFLGALGNPTVGSCVAKTTLAENSGTAFKATGDMFPFSAAQWIAQKNGVATNTVKTGLSLATVNGAAPVAVSGGRLVPGALFGVLTRPAASGTGVFARDTYTVIPTAKRNSDLEKTLVKAAKATSVLKDFGFGPLTYAGNPSFYKSGGFQS